VTESQSTTNVLLITSDQHRGDCWGPTQRAVRTPHLNSLVRRGAHFPNAIAAAPVCQPSRASILTGLLPNSHGVWDNGLDLEADVAGEGLASRLGQRGYLTGLIGKAHFSARLPYAPTGSPEDRTSPHDPDWVGPYMGFEHVELALSGDLDQPPLRPPYGQHYERWLYHRSEGDAIERAFSERIVPSSEPAQTWHSTVPPAWHVSTWCADRTIALLRSAARAQRPFCVWMSFPDPHHPFDCPEPWSRLYDPQDVDLPPHRTLDLSGKPWWHEASLGHEPRAATDWARNLRSSFSRVTAQTDLQLASIIANYYGMIALLDHNIGRVLKELELLNLDQRTLVIFTSDHGEWLGDHGLLLKGPMLYEGLLRVGCAIAGPGVPKGVTIDAPISTLDLPATILDVVGQTIPQHWHSRSLMPVINRTEDRQYAYVEWDVDPSRCGVPLSLRTVRTRESKLTIDVRSGDGEMYDLAGDPYELKNLYYSADHAVLRDALLRLISDRPPGVRDKRPLIGIG
jgi:arylsulfatase A-like enzyme